MKQGKAPGFYKFQMPKEVKYETVTGEKESATIVIDVTGAETAESLGRFHCVDLYAGTAETVHLADCDDMFA